jgi:hypothetical protein
VSEDYRRVSLDTIAGGAAGERFQEAVNYHALKGMACKTQDLQRKS